MNHYAKMCFLAILLALSTKEVTAEMITVNRMNDVKITVEQLLQQYQDKEILTAFDIDMTLTQPNNPATFYPALIKHYAIYKKIMSSLTPEQKDLTATLTVFLPVRLVEADTPQIVSAIQDRGVKTIAFTAMLTGKLEDKNQAYNKIEVLRYNALNSLGINFANNFAEKEIYFNDLPSHNNSYPAFYNGILFTNGEQGKNGKGSVLIKFIQRTSMSLKAIVLVDDKKKNLEDVEQFLKNHHPAIKFIGIEYQGALGYTSKNISAEKFQSFWEDMANTAKSSTLATIQVNK